MKILAVDTATERCSVALRIADRCLQREAHTTRAHADLVLPMVQELLSEAAVTLRDLDGIAYGRGPGAFTGVRVAVGVVQGLAFGARLATVGISNLAAVAQQVGAAGHRVLVCMDARMSEVYWGVFAIASDGYVILETDERVSAPDAVEADGATLLAGTGFAAYPALRERFAAVPVHPDVLPRAREIAELGARELTAGRGRRADETQPMYLRNKVTFVKEM